MMYTVKPEFIDQWGETTNDVITEDDLEMIARGWETPAYKLLCQLNVYNYESAVSLMDDEIREAVHADLAPCSEIEFMMEYERRHLEKYGTKFEY